MSSLEYGIECAIRNSFSFSIPSASIPKPLEVSSFRDDGESGLCFDSQEARQLVNVLRILFVGSQFLYPLIQSFQLVYKAIILLRHFASEWH